MIVFWHVNGVNTMMTTASETDTGVSTTQIDVEKILGLQDNDANLDSFTFRSICPATLINY